LILAFAMPFAARAVFLFRRVDVRITGGVGKYDLNIAWLTCAKACAFIACNAHCTAPQVGENRG
jgi:hypothetical protein